MKAEEVASYLRDNPTFFGTHADLLSLLTVPHPHGGKAISLTERQLYDLREKVREFEEKLNELIAYGRENDIIGDKVHAFTLALMVTKDFPQLRQAIYSQMKNSFSVPYTAFRVWGLRQSAGEAEFAPVDEDIRQFTNSLGEPYCGPLPLEAVNNWFTTPGCDPQSVVRVPLREDDRPSGLLALASDDPNRFVQGMGTLFVERMGEIVAAALVHRAG